MTLILNIETATDICSVAVSNGNRLLAKAESEQGNQHSTQLTLLIDEVVKKAGVRLKSLSAVALSSGPGSYTSLRVGSSVAKGICYALNIPLIAVDTLQSLATGAFDKIKDPNALYCAMIDARRMEVYMAIYDASGNEVKGMEARIIDVELSHELLALNKKIILSGDGVKKSLEILTFSHFQDSETICNSSNMLHIAYQKYMNNNFSDIAYFSPEYLKAPNITAAKKVL